MKKILIALSLLPVLSFAGIESGTWNGSNCSMIVGAQTFENNMRHPLNERIVVTTGNITHIIRHPHIVNAADGNVSFNHDLFESVIATKTGAIALQITMVHTDQYEGPSSLTVIESNWKTGKNTVMNCSDLKKID